MQLFALICVYSRFHFRKAKALAWIFHKFTTEAQRAQKFQRVFRLLEAGISYRRSHASISKRLDNSNGYLLLCALCISVVKNAGLGRSI